MHFYLDYTKILTSGTTNSDTFGAISSDIYRCGSVLSTSGLSKAFACQTGLLLVIPSLNSSKVNLILKPTQTTLSKSFNIKYYIYRGIDKSDFVNSGTIESFKTTSSVDVISELVNAHNSYNTQNSTKTKPAILLKDIGYESDTIKLANSVNIDAIFFSDQNINPIHVNEGTWIGNFLGNEASLEIILENDTMDLDIGYAKLASISTIDVSSLSGIAKKAKRDEVLHYLDPAALWGTYFDAGIDRRDDNKAKTTVSTSDLYSSIISKYNTKNRVYLDIRSEYGYSYNYYENYKVSTSNLNNIKIGNTSTLTDKIYQSDFNSWPIGYWDAPFNTSTNFNELSIQLRQDDNTKPIIFCEESNLFDPTKQNRCIEKFSFTAGWTNAVKLYHRNSGSGSSRDSIARYIRLYYFRGEFNTSTSSASVLARKFYGDNVFGHIGLYGISNLNRNKNLENNLPSNNSGAVNSSTNIFSSISKENIIFDTNRIVFKIEKKHTIRSSKSNIAFHRVTDKTKELKSYSIDSPATAIFGSCGIKYIKIKDGSNDVTIIVAKNIDNISISSESIIHLGILRSELDSLKNLNGFSNLHKKYIFLEEILPSSGVNHISSTSGSSIRYRKFKLKVQGWDSNGNSIIQAPPSDLIVYKSEIDNSGFIYASKAFSDMESYATSELSRENMFNPIPIETSKPNYLFEVVKRIAVNYEGKKEYPLYELNGNVIQKYLSNENYYDNSAIPINTEIKLCAGTRCVLVAESKINLGSLIRPFYICCYYNGKYREGLIERSAFEKSIARVNEEDFKNAGSNDTYVVQSFLDDAFHIATYHNIAKTILNDSNHPNHPFVKIINEVNANLDIFKLKSLQEKKSMLINLRNYFIEDLSDNFLCKDSNKEPNWVTYNNYTNKSLKSPLDLIYRSVQLDNYNFLNGNKRTFYLWITAQWMDKAIENSSFYDEVKNKLIINSLLDSLCGRYRKIDELKYIVNNSYDSGSGVVCETNDLVYNGFLESIILLKEKLKLFSNSSSATLNSSNGIVNWINKIFKSYNNIVSESITFDNCVILSAAATNISLKNKFKCDQVAVDQSIGFIDSILPMSIAIHETNDKAKTLRHNLTIENKVYFFNSKFLFFDAHLYSLDFKTIYLKLNKAFVDKGNLSSEIEIDQNILKNNIFKDEKDTYKFGYNLWLGTSMNISLIYLNFHLKKMLL